MSDEATTEEVQTDVPVRKQGTVGYAASFYPARGQKRDISLYLPFDVPEDPAQIASAVRAAFFEAKTAVAEQSNGVIQGKIEYLGENGEDLVLTEDIEATVAAINEAFPGTTEVQPEQQSQSGGNSGGNSGGGRSVKVRKPLEGQPIPEWLEAQAAEAGVTEVWDNRKFLPDFGGTGNAKAPWFKCVDSGKGIWPPRNR